MPLEPDKENVKKIDTIKRPAPSQLPDPQPADVSLNINTGPISRGEIRSALTDLTNAKAPGVDNIPP